MTTVRELFAAAGLQPQGCVRWGAPPPLTTPGVYVVATTSNPDDTPAPVSFSVDRDAVRSLLQRRPEIAVDGVTATEESLCARLGQMWLSTEPAVYIGLAGTSVRQRVGQYYKTPLGARSPHAGGWPIKVLANLSDLWVHFAPSADPTRSEIAMLAAFLRGVPPEIAATSCDPGNALPYANLVDPGGRRKSHGITGAKEGRGITAAPRERVLSAARPSPTTPRQESNATVDAISRAIQDHLRLSGERSVSAVDAASRLASKGLLKDSASRPGLPLRRLLRSGAILGQRQESNGRWFIDFQG